MVLTNSIIYIYFNKQTKLFTYDIIQTSIIEQNVIIMYCAHLICYCKYMFYNIEAMCRVMVI